MSRFLLASWGFESHLDTFLALGKELRQQGHKVAIYTDRSHQPSVEAIGATLLPFQSLNQAQAEEIIAHVIANRNQPWKLWNWWRQFLIDTIPAQLGDLRRAWNTFSPDVLVCDMAMWGPLTVLHETLNTPIAVLSHIGFCIQPGDIFGPVPGRAMPPRRRPLQRLAARVVAALSASAAHDARRSVNQIRRTRGLAPVSIRMTEFCARMDLYLIPTSQTFDYNRADLPDSVRYVGPCLFPPPSGQYIGSVGPRAVVVDEGTLYTKDAVMVRAAQVLTGYRTTILAGKHRDPRDLEPAVSSDSVSVRAWRPLHQALGDASIVITNGNTESVMAALLRGLPMVVVPAIMDQHEVALRVAESGAGINLPERQCTAGALKAAVARLFAEPSFRENAERLGKELRAMNGPQLAVQQLEQLAASYAAASSFPVSV
jgi:MGT family glycosyltransferase